MEDTGQRDSTLSLTRNISQTWAGLGLTNLETDSRQSHLEHLKNYQQNTSTPYKILNKIIPLRQVLNKLKGPISQYRNYIRCKTRLDNGILHSFVAAGVHLKRMMLVEIIVGMFWFAIYLVAQKQVELCEGREVEEEAVSYQTDVILTGIVQKLTLKVISASFAFELMM